MNPLICDNLPCHSPKVIVALDFPDEVSTLQFTRSLSPDLCALKVGKELFTATGRSLVEKLIAQGFKIFLDLKYHDIPNTVASACAVAAQMGVWMVDMHALGGAKMMNAAADAIANFQHKPLLIAVTVLTSMDDSDLAQVGIHTPAAEMVLNLAQLAQQSGMDGTVSSAQEARILRNALGEAFCLVTPGIRLQSLGDDQKRVMTPADAIVAGASYLVIGRPITKATHPLEVLHSINASIANPPTKGSL